MFGIDTFFLTFSYRGLIIVGKETGIAEAIGIAGRGTENVRDAVTVPVHHIVVDPVGMITSKLIELIAIESAIATPIDMRDVTVIMREREEEVAAAQTDAANGIQDTMNLVVEEAQRQQMLIPLGNDPQLPQSRRESRHRI